MPKVILCRHAEEPQNPQFKSIQTAIGMSYQGAVRTYLLPQLIEKLFNGNEYEVHTYTNSKNNIPVSRSYYTVQLLKGTRKFYNTSNDIDKLINGIKKSKSNNILVCWKHSHFETIIKKLTKININLKNIIKDLTKINTNNQQNTLQISTSEILNITRCSPEYKTENELCKYDITKNDIKFSPIFILDTDKNTLHVSASYTLILNKETDTWTAIDLSNNILTYK